MYHEIVDIMYQHIVDTLYHDIIAPKYEDTPGELYIIPLHILRKKLGTFKNCSEMQLAHTFDASVGRRKFRECCTYRFSRCYIPFGNSY